MTCESKDNVDGKELDGKISPLDTKQGSNMLCRMAITYR